MKADHEKIKRLLKTASGQIDGILKMVDGDQYCLDISNQILAAQAILKRANTEILKAHLQCCVREAFEADDTEKKIDELVGLIDKLSK